MEPESDGLNQHGVGGKLPEPEGLPERQNPFNPAVPFLVEASHHQFAPKNGEAKGSRGAIVGWVYAMFDEKDPKMRHFPLQKYA